MKNINWFEQGIELLVVFIGITAAFLLNNWRSDLETKELEQKYLHSLLEDVRADSVLLQNAMETNHKKTEAIHNFLYETIEQKNWSLDSVLTISVQVFNVINFSQNRTTYTSILNSGDFKIFENYDLTKSVVKYYKQYDHVKIVEDIYLNSISDMWTPFLFEHIDVIHNKLINEKVFRQPQFSNLVAGAYSGLMQKDNSYEIMDSLNNILRLKLIDNIH